MLADHWTDTNAFTWVTIMWCHAVQCDICYHEEWYWQMDKQLKHSARFLQQESHLLAKGRTLIETRKTSSKFSWIPGFWLSSLFFSEFTNFQCASSTQFYIITKTIQIFHFSVSHHSVIQTKLAQLLCILWVQSRIPRSSFP